MNDSLTGEAGNQKGEIVVEVGPARTLLVHCPAPPGCSLVAFLRSLSQSRRIEAGAQLQSHHRPP
jgi:hypothetical protein